MECSPLLFRFMDLDPDSDLELESETQPIPQVGTNCFDLELPTVISRSAVPNDVVFCGKVINHETQPRGNKNTNPFMLLRLEFSPGRSNRAAELVRSASTQENLWRRSNKSGQKHRNDLFGMVKFQLQMELSDMKMRQERREPLRLPLPKLAVEHGGSNGEESCLELDQPLKRRNRLMNALAKATFG